VSSLGLLLALVPAVSAQVDIPRPVPGLLAGSAATFTLGDLRLAASNLLAGSQSMASVDESTSATTPRPITVQDATEPLPRPWTLNVQPTYTANHGGGSTSYLQLQPILRFDVGLPLGMRFESKPIITLDFEKNTSSVPLDLVIGRFVAGKWKLYAEGTVFPWWTSKPTNDYTITLNIGYVTESPLQRR